MQIDKQRHWRKEPVRIKDGSKCLSHASDKVTPPAPGSHQTRTNRENGKDKALLIEMIRLLFHGRLHNVRLDSLLEVKRK